MNILEARRRTLGADVYKKTVQGNPLIVRSLARMRPGLNVYGKSTQQTTTGAQLFDLRDSETSLSGISYIVKDGAIIATGTATASAVVGETILSLPNGTYYVSGKNSDLVCWIKISYSDDKPAAYFNNTSFNVDDTAAEITAYAQVDKGKTVNNAVIYPMLNAGSSALPWEPYTGGKPSPSPDYPQEIENAGDDGSIQVDVLGKNIFNPNYFADHYETEGVVFYLGYKVPAGSKWTCSTSKPEKEGAIKDVFFSATVAFSSLRNGVSDQISRTVVADSGMIYLGIRNGHLTSIVNGNYWVQIEPSESATDYSPYTSQTLTVQTPNGLPGIPVTSGGNYTDENGQQWICDEIDFKRGKYVQRISCKEFTGNETVKTTGYNTVFVIGTRDANYEAPALCNMFVYVSARDIGYTPAGFSVSSYSKGVVFNLDWIDTPKDAETAKAWFAQKYSEGTPVKVYYVLATHIETDLTEEQMAAYANLHTNRPTTVVSATDGAGIKLTYKTKKSLEVN